MEKERWGVLYCPKSSYLTTPSKRWEKVEKCLKANEIDFDFVQSESQDAD